MAFYIKVDENNLPIDHPHLFENMKMLYPDHDFSSGPPSGWLEFVRHLPAVGVYQKFDDSVGADRSQGFPHNGLEYKLIDGKIQDFWHYIDFTDDEKKAKQDAIKAKWAALDPSGPASWSFNETTCRYEAPVAYPSDGKDYYWDESTTSWKEEQEGSYEL